MNNILHMKNSEFDEICACVMIFFGADIEDIKKMVRSLKTDNDFYSNVVILSEYLKDEIKSDEISVRYLMNKLSNENICRLAILKQTVSSDFNYQEFVDEYNKQLRMGACVRIKDLCISGSDLIKMGIPKGPMVGEVLEKLLCAVIENKCSNSTVALMCEIKKIITEG